MPYLRTLLLVLMCNLIPIASVQAHDHKLMEQNAEDAFANLEDRFTLRFFNAVNGKPISNAKVTFEGQQSRTNAEGAVTFAIPHGLDDEETRKVRFDHDGYVRTEAPVTFMVGTLFFNRYSISPALPPGRIRVVLDWRKKPADLDAHLVKTGIYHLSYREMKKYQDKAWLDRDDQDGYGPETVTVLKLDSKARYSYYVHDYTHREIRASGKLSDSRAHVRVYSDRGLMHTFRVPQNAKGNLWKVFDVVDGRVRPSGQVSDAP